MSLRVWLPLNGDLHNQGLSNITVANNGATVNSSGKIGSCYYFNGSAQYLQFSDSLGNIYSNDFSWAVWLKPTDDTRGIIISEYSSAGASNVAFELLANRVIRVYWNGSPDWSFSAIPKDVWSHVAITKHVNTIKVYINGVESGSKTTTLSARPSTAKIRIGDDYRGGTNVSYMGYMNDVRIYDHALSALEVKEIARAKVLHYPLCDKNVEMTTNLCNGLKSGGRTTLSSNPIKITTTGENADTYWYIKTSTALVSGTIYTISLNCTGLSNGEYWKFGVGAQSGNNNCGYFSIYQGYNTFTFTLPSGLDGATQLILDDMGGSLGIRSKITNFFNVQLEAKDHATAFVNYGTSRTSALVYDISGYCNNGTIIGDLEVSTNTPKYNVSTVFDGNSTCIKIPYNEINPDRIFTVNLWFKKDTLGTKNYETLFGGPSGFEMDTRSGSSTTLSLYMASARGGNVFSPFNFNQWYMITMVRDGTNEMYYINAELKKTIEAKSMPSGQYYIGSWYGTSKQNYYGNISDFRIYATALSAQDILSLYHNSALVDEQGIIHGAIH